MTNKLALIFILGFSFHVFAEDCATEYDPHDSIIQAFIQARHKPIDQDSWITQNGIDFNMTGTATTFNGEVKVPGDINLVINKISPTLVSAFHLDKDSQKLLNLVIKHKSPLQIYLCKINGQLQIEFLGMVSEKLAKKMNVTPSLDGKTIQLDMTLNDNKTYHDSITVD